MPNRMKRALLCAVVSSSCVLGACSSVAPFKKETSSTSRISAKTTKAESTGAVPPAGWERSPQGSGYYLDDGPGEYRPINLAELPDAEPQIEPIVLAKTKPYETMGQSFIPQKSLEEPYKQKGHASWYGRKFHGSKTATGEIYDMYQMTAAHPTLPLPCYVKVTNLNNRRSVIVRVNDRGPFLRNRLIDLSYAAALKLDLIGHGSAEVLVEKMTPERIAAFQTEQLNSVGVLPVSLSSAPAQPTAKRTPLYLQIGAFGSRNSAENLLGQVVANSQNLGKSGQILSDSGLHRVLLGPFGTLEQANDAAMQLAEFMAVKPVIKQDLILP